MILDSAAPSTITQQKSQAYHLIVKYDTLQFSSSIIMLHLKHPAKPVEMA